jgi:hypothetical protein
MRGGVRRALTSLRRLAYAREVLLAAIWTGLVVVWASTCVQLAVQGSWRYAAFAAADIVLLVILYLAEGMELAVTDLLDKDPEQVANASVRAVLREIQARRDFFYANRQMFVVAVIAFMSLTTAYPRIVVPGVGEVSADGAPFWFSFLLTTLTVLWFAQVTPKRLAIMNSELFLDQSRPIWFLIRIVGLLGLPNLTDLMVGLVRGHTPYRERRLLLPSRSTHYSVQARLYGYSLDRLATIVTLERDGTVTVRKRFLVLLLHGAHSGAYGSIEMPGEPCRQARARVLGLYLAPVPEQLDELAHDLDEAFAGRPSGLERVGPHDWRHEIEVRAEQSSGSSATVYCEIRGESLPETFQSGPAPNGQPRLAALMYELEARFRPDPSEPCTSWPETVELPCRVLMIEARAAAGARVAVAVREVAVTMAQAQIERAGESARLSRQALANRGRTVVAYPLVGATYALHWTTVRGSGLVPPTP